MPKLPSSAYYAADDACRRAFAEYEPIRAAYRAREVGDAEFLAAKAKYQAALDAFDKVCQDEA